MLLRPLTLDDSTFIFQLVNTEDFKNNIGDRGVNSPESAINYIQNGPLASYQNRGYGPWCIMDREQKSHIGIVGLYKREYLEFPDLGYAILPEFYRKGFTSEACFSILEYYRKLGRFPKLFAITHPSNEPSQRLLTKLGFNEKTEKPSASLSDKLFEIVLNND